MTLAMGVRSGRFHTAIAARPPGRSTRAASRIAAARSAAYWTPLKLVTRSKAASGKGKASRSATSKRAAGVRARA